MQHLALPFGFSS